MPSLGVCPNCASADDRDILSCVYISVKTAEGLMVKSGMSPFWSVLSGMNLNKQLHVIPQGLAVARLREFSASISILGASPSDKP